MKKTNQRKKEQEDKIIIKILKRHTGSNWKKKEDPEKRTRKTEDLFRRKS